MYSIISALAVPVLMGVSGALPAWAGVIVAMAGLVLFVWLAVIAVHLEVARNTVVEVASAQPHAAIRT